MLRSAVTFISRLSGEILQIRRPWHYLPITALEYPFMNLSEDYGNETTAEYDYYEEYDFTSAYTGAILNIIIIPVQLLVAKVGYCTK